MRMSITFEDWPDSPGFRLIKTSGGRESYLRGWTMLSGRFSLACLAPIRAYPHYFISPAISLLRIFRSLRRDRDMGQ